MLAEFRALGGTADNVCLRNGPFGRGLFPADPSRPIKVLIPESLLLDLKDVEVENNVFRVSKGAQTCAREKAFLESYEREFSWGVGRQETEALLQMMLEAPGEIRELLDKRFGAGRWLAGPMPETIRERYFVSRVIGYKGRDVVMPIVELANHGHATKYETQDGVGLSGQFAGEILVRYQLCDPWTMFVKWGFASDSEFLALSLPGNLEDPNLSIGRREINLESKTPFFPEVTVDGSRIILSHMMLGNRNFPRLSRGIFRRVMRNAGLQNEDETFDLIQHLNRGEYYKLLEVSELAAPPLGRLLRKAVRHQLEAMSHSIGTRDV